MMRWIPFAICLSTPAVAWEFTDSPICTLTNDGNPLTVQVTFDPAIGEYAIHLTLPASSAGWANAPVFALQFTGARSLTISTPSHSLSEDQRTVTVRDSGFGNVLNGLQYNAIATAMLGNEAIMFSLTDAADPVESFRNCRGPLTG